MGSLDLLGAEAAQIIVTLIVSKYEDDVGLSRRVDKYCEEEVRRKEENK